MPRDTYRAETDVIVFPEFRRVEWYRPGPDHWRTLATNTNFVEMSETWHHKRAKSGTTKWRLAGFIIQHRDASRVAGPVSIIRPC